MNGRGETLGVADRGGAKTSPAEGEAGPEGAEGAVEGSHLRCGNGEALAMGVAGLS